MLAILIIPTSWVEGSSWGYTIMPYDAMSLRPSVRMLGLANCGVALTDIVSFPLNPASLQMRHPNGSITLTLYPSKTHDESYDYAQAPEKFYYGLIYGVPHKWTNGFFCKGIAIGFFHTNQETWDYGRTDEAANTIQSGGDVFASNNLTVSMQNTGKFTLGIGLTCKRYKQTFKITINGLDQSKSFASYAFDAGLFAKTSIRLSQDAGKDTSIDGYYFDPSLGLAVHNLGKDFNFIDVWQADPLPRNLRVGCALSFNNMKRNYSVASLTPLIELQRSLVGDGEWTTVYYAAELSVVELGTIRWGRARDIIMDEVALKGWGYSFSTANLKRLIGRDDYENTARAQEGILDKIFIEGTYARFNQNGYDTLPGENYFEITIVYNF
jgi:hypothetical protein